MVTALVVARLQVRGDAFNRLWAEDGKVYLSDVQSHGLASLLYTYAGYLQTLPRVLALASQALPVRDYPTYAVLASALVVGALAAFVYLTAMKVLGSAASAALSALAMALTPVLGLAALGTLADLQWFLIFAAFWAMLVPPRGTRPYSATIVAGLATLTSPLAVLVAPAAVVTHGRRDALRSWPLLALLAGTAVQVIALAFAPRDAGGPGRGGLSTSTVRSAVKSLFKDVLGPSYGPSSFRMIVGLALAGLLLLAWWLARGQRRLANLSLITGLLIYCVTCAVTGHATDRYDAIAAMFMIATLACLLAHLDRRAAVGALGIVLLLFLVSFPASRRRLSGPSWSAAIARHDTECRRSSLRATEVQQSPRGWVMRLSC